MKYDGSSVKADQTKNNFNSFNLLHLCWDRVLIFFLLLFYFFSSREI